MMVARLSGISVVGLQLDHARDGASGDDHKLNPREPKKNRVDSSGMSTLGRQTSRSKQKGWSSRGEKLYFAPTST